MRISHEAIYQSLYVQGRGALRRELTACLRTGRALRVPRAHTRINGVLVLHKSGEVSFLSLFRSQSVLARLAGLRGLP